jgi:hypothetical protein
MPNPLASATTRTPLSPLRKRLDEWLDSRMGNALFVGADLPDVAAELVSRGIPVMVVETSASKLERFMAECRRLGIDKRVSIDLRPYATIALEMSSFNVIVAWEGVPAGMTALEFFKKTRRELKAGCKLYLRVAVRPPEPALLGKLRQQPLAARLLAGARQMAQRLPLKDLGERLPLKALWDLPTFEYLKAEGGKHLKVERVEWGSFMAPLLAKVEAGPLSALVSPLVEFGNRFDGQLRREALSPEVLIEASKTLDLGKVFLTGSRFDPEA